MLEANIMLQFKPIRNRVIGFGFCCYFLAFCCAPVALYIISGDSAYVETLQQFLPLFALIAYTIAHTKAKSALADIEVHEEYIVGPGPLTLFPFQQKRIKVHYAQLTAPKGLLSNNQLLKLGGNNGEHIRIIKALYEPALFDTLKAKINAWHTA
jgi:hypothetical protein